MSNIIKDYLSIFCFWTIVAVIIGFLLSWSIGEIVWLFTPAGSHFNSDTIPLQASINILFDAFINPWTYFIWTPVGYVLAALGFKIATNME